MKLHQQISPTLIPLLLLFFWPNYKLHPLILVKVQFSSLSFDRFNSVPKFQIASIHFAVKSQLSNAVSQPHFNIFNILK
jgi:hypothetical protein